MRDEILLNVDSKEVRYAHLRNGELYDLIIGRKKARQITGNIYRGRVTNFLLNIQSAFIDIQEGENGFIHISDILENRKKFEELFDMDFDLENSPTPEQEELQIEQLLKPDQPVLVQVIKEPIGSKGARLTSNISIAGRFLVLLPNSPHRGVSKKIEERSLRDALKKRLRTLPVPPEIGLICRTASTQASEEMLFREAEELVQTWRSIVESFHKATGPTLLYEESDLFKRAVLTCVDKQFDRLLVDDFATYQTCRKLYAAHANENHAVKIEFYRDKTPMFERFHVERDIEKATRRKIWLKSGGYLFFERTEAMYTIDVNSGRSSNNKEGNVEETLMQINLEAAEEIAKQLRIRNIGGLVICDFIDMRLKKNHKRLLDRLKECMKEDSAKCTVLGMSAFGVIEMTRQRSRESLVQTLFTSCPYCGGSGLVKSHETVSISLERSLKKLLHQETPRRIEILCHPELLSFLQGEDKAFFVSLAKRQGASLLFSSSDTLHLNDYQLNVLEHGSPR